MTPHLCKALQLLKTYGHRSAKARLPTSSVTASSLSGMPVLVSSSLKRLAMKRAVAVEDTETAPGISGMDYMCILRHPPCYFAIHPSLQNPRERPRRQLAWMHNGIISRSDKDKSFATAKHQVRLLTKH